MSVQGFDRLPAGVKLRGANIAPALGDTGGWGDMWLDWAARIAPGGDIYEQVILAASAGANCLRIMFPTGQALRGELEIGDYNIPDTIVGDFKHLHDLAAAHGMYLNPTTAISDGDGVHWDHNVYNDAAVIATAVAIANKIKNAAHFPRVVCIDGMNEGNSWVQSDPGGNMARSVALADALRTEVAGSGIPVTVSLVFNAFGSTIAAWANNADIGTLIGHVDYLDLHLYRAEDAYSQLSDTNDTLYQYRVDGKQSSGATGRSIPLMIGEVGESVYRSDGADDTARQRRFLEAAQFAAHPNIVGVFVWCIKSAVTAPGAGGGEDLPQDTFGLWNANGDPYTGTRDARTQYQTWPKKFANGVSIDYRVLDDNGGGGFITTSTDPASPDLWQYMSGVVSPGEELVIKCRLVFSAGTSGGEHHARLFLNGPGGLAPFGAGVFTATAGETLTEEDIEVTVPAGYYSLHVGTWKVGGGTAYFGGTPRQSDASGFSVIVPDVTAPTVMEATIDAAGTTLTVAFSEEIAAGTLTGFVLSGSAELGAGTLADNLLSATYAISPAVFVGDVRTLSYSGTSIEDLAGNALAAFSGMDVVNDSDVSASTRRRYNKGSIAPFFTRGWNSNSEEEPGESVNLNPGEERRSLLTAPRRIPGRVSYPAKKS